MNIIGRLIEGRTVMVTGAGGSIGSEICRQLLHFNPRMLLLVGRGENRIFKVERKLRAIYSGARCKPALPTSRTRPASASSSRSFIRKSCSTPPRTSTCP